MAPAFSFKGEVVDVSLAYNRSSAPLLHTIIPSKLFPKAVARNKIKRWCREVWRKSEIAHTRGAITTIRIKKRTATFHTIEKDLTYMETSFNQKTVRIH